MHYADYKTILSPKNGFNLYRGCTHGCIYCDSRSKCYQFTHDFEDIEVKRNAAEILEGQLRRKRKRCMLSSGAMCDPYIPLESELKLTRQCLKVIERYGFGVAIQTKSNLVLRDLVLLKAINTKAKAVVQMTLTTVNESLCRILEPNVCTTAERFRALEVFRDNGISTTVWLCPILPWINDTEENVRGILDYCVRAKVTAIVHFGIGLTLRDGDREYFYQKLDRHFPDLKGQYIRTFGNAYEIPSPNAKRLQSIVRETCDRHGIMLGFENVFKWLWSFPEPNDQLTFEDL
ncbi:MAG: radical SAM protein [Oscillospiraceae bacterium]|jgi:DNA repair photolyase|nr:radical SAM protein [Oscillospiraceae bacterium]